MNISTGIYCGDIKMSIMLKKAGSKLSISEVYGLFYGCTASPHLVTPSQYYPIIFGEEGGSYNTIEEAKHVNSQLTALLNLISMWDPENEPISFPDLGYPETYEGTAKQVRDIYSLVEYFIKGLDMGHVAETDFSKGGIEALKALSETGIFLCELAELLEKEKDGNDEKLKKALESVNHLKEMTGNCIADMNLALKEAREREIEQMQMLSETADNKGSAPCPCGSGKTYEKCCGLVH